MEPADFLLIFSLAVLSAYVVLGAMVGKYSFGGVVAGMLYISIYAVRSLSSVSPQRVAFLVGALVVVVILHLLAVPVLQLKQPGAVGRSDGLAAAFADSRNVSLALALCSLLAFGALTWRWLSGPALARVWILTVAYALAANSVNQVKTVVTSEDRSPYRPLRERGFNELVKYMNTYASPDTTVLAPKDFGYYFGGHHFVIDLMIIFAGAESLDSLVDEGAVQFVVDSTAFPQFPDIEAFASKHGLKKVMRIHDFVILRLPVPCADRTLECHP